MHFSDSLSTDSTINARLTLDDGSRISGEVINFLKEGAALLFSSPKSLTPLTGLSGTATFSLKGVSLLTARVEVKHVIDEGLMQMCGVRFTELPGSYGEQTAALGEDAHASVSSTLSWATPNGREVLNAPVTALASGKIRLDDKVACEELPLDILECEAVLGFPEPVGHIRLTFRRLLTNEPCSHMFAARGGATCLATQLIGLWAFKSALGRCVEAAVPAWNQS